MPLGLAWVAAPTPPVRDHSTSHGFKSLCEIGHAYGRQIGTDFPPHENLIYGSGPGGGLYVRCNWEIVLDRYNNMLNRCLGARS
jgi:hypothetical protein